MRPLQPDRKSEPSEVPHSSASVVDECYRQYATKLFAYLCRHMLVNDAEDVLFEIFLVALEHEQELEIMLEDNQRAWLWTVARNKIIDYQRKHARHRIIPLEHLAEMIDSESTPEEVVMQHEEYASLHAYLKQLSPMQQEVLELRFTAGLRCTEIAQVLNKKEGTIRTMLSRAINTLRDLYQQQARRGLL